jgi:hypothetical protein
VQKVQSQIFGETDLLDETEPDYQLLKFGVERYPVNTFGILNKILNARGLLIQIRPIDGEMTPTELDPGILKG